MGEMMFTGLIEHLGIVKSNKKTDKGQRLEIEVASLPLVIGESIAVNGVCLTLVSYENSILAFDLSPETLAVTNLQKLLPGMIANLERALTFSARLGGHIVTGHVDTCATVESIKEHGEYRELVMVGFSAETRRYLLPKGSIALDGVSLTITKADKHGITLMLIPHTIANTNLSKLAVGQVLNVEFDYFTRIVAHQLCLSGQLKGETV